MLLYRKYIKKDIELYIYNMRLRLNCKFINKKTFLLFNNIQLNKFNL